MAFFSPEFPMLDPNNEDGHGPHPAPGRRRAGRSVKGGDALEIGGFAALI